jgi:hypothetical protein
LRAEDKSVEELAEEDKGSADLIAIDRDDWGMVTAQIEELFEVGETCGPTVATAWLTVRRIGWRWVTPAPGRERMDGAVHRTPRVTARRSGAGRPSNRLVPRY